MISILKTQRAKRQALLHLRQNETLLTVGCISFNALSMINELIANINDHDFENQVIQADKPVLLDFWAEWCGPCKAIAPILDELAADFDGKAKICKMNIDNNQQTPVKFGIRSIPTLLVFKNGQVVDQIIGLQNKEQLADKLNKHL